MKQISIQRRDGTEIEVTSDEVAKLRHGIRGSLIGPEDPDYDERRKVWNGTVDKRPGLIALCRGVADVMKMVHFAKDKDLILSTRGGGHNVSGSAVADQGLVIDLTEMRTVKVNPEEKTAWVQGGALLGDLDNETAPFGLAAPVGVVSETGVGGLTLHGGVGWLLRKHGMSIDNLKSVELVTSDGKMLKASKDHYKDLFWALRGGGGNFGVVTALEFYLHPIEPVVSYVMPLYPLEDATEIIHFADDYMKTAPRDLMLIGIYWTVPELEEIPEDDAGKPAITLLGCYSGPRDQAENVVGPLRNVRKPIIDLSADVTWVEAQSMLDEDYPEGKYYYWKSLYFDRLEDEALEIIKKYNLTKPSEESTIDIWFLGGAMQDVDPKETSFANRHHPYMLAIEANWSDPQRNEENIQWARNLHKDLKPYSGKGVYLNFPGFAEDQAEMREGAFGENLDRLQKIKEKYDPTGLFSGLTNFKNK